MLRTLCCSTSHIDVHLMLVRVGETAHPGPPARIGPPTSRDRALGALRALGLLREDRPETAGPSKNGGVTDSRTANYAHGWPTIARPSSDLASSRTQPPMPTPIPIPMREPKKDSHIHHAQKL
eukprot:1206398-Pyramimonas_sp.AAC.1